MQQQRNNNKSQPQQVQQQKTTIATKTTSKDSKNSNNNSNKMIDQMMYNITKFDQYLKNNVVFISIYNVNRLFSSSYLHPWYISFTICLLSIDRQLVSSGFVMQQPPPSPNIGSEPWSRCGRCANANWFEQWCHHGPHVVP